MTILARKSIHDCDIRGVDIVELFPSGKIKAIEFTSLTHLARRLEEGRRGGMGRLGGDHRKRTTGAMPFVGAAFPILEPAVGWQDVGKAPDFAPLRRPSALWL